MCPAINDDWDRFGSLEEIAAWTNPKVLPQLIGLPRDQVNVVLADFYPVALTQEAIALNKGAARVEVVINEVNELECHDCLSLKPDPDYYPLISISRGTTFFSPWGAFVGPHLETSGTDIRPFWTAMRSVPFENVSTVVNFDIRLYDENDLFPDQISKIAGPNEFIRYTFPFPACNPALENCDRGVHTNVSVTSSGEEGTFVFNSSRIDYSINICEWSSCFLDAGNKAPRGRRCLRRTIGRRASRREARGAEAKTSEEDSWDRAPSRCALRRR